MVVGGWWPTIRGEYIPPPSHRWEEIFAFSWTTDDRAKSRKRFLFYIQKLWNILKLDEKTKKKRKEVEREKQKGEQILSRHFVDTKFDELGIEKY